MRKIRLIIADDHSVVRSGLKMLFRSSREFAVVGEAEDGRAALALIEKRKPDVAILDLSMPVLSGVEAARLMRQRHPSLGILILTIYDSEEYVYQLMRAGANGYVLKNARRSELLAAVRTVAAGERFFSPGISKLMVDQFIKRSQRENGTHHTAGRASLTSRETEILTHICQGMTNAQIARKLFLSVRTVDTHRSNLMQKLEIHDTATLVRFAFENGLVDVKPKL